MCAILRNVTPKKGEPQQYIEVCLIVSLIVSFGYRQKTFFSELLEILNKEIKNIYVKYEVVIQPEGAVTTV